MPGRRESRAYPRLTSGEIVMLAIGPRTMSAARVPGASSCHRDGDTSSARGACDDIHPAVKTFPCHVLASDTPTSIPRTRTVRPTHAAGCTRNDVTTCWTVYADPAAE